MKKGTSFHPAVGVTLAACSQENLKMKKTSKTEQTSQPERTVGSKSQPSSQKKAEVGSM